MENRSTKEETLQNVVPEKEVQEILGVSKEGLSRLRYEKKLPFVEVNRKSRIYIESSLVKWISDQEKVLNKNT